MKISDVIVSLIPGVALFVLALGMLIVVVAGG